MSIVTSKRSLQKKFSALYKDLIAERPEIVAIAQESDNLLPVISHILNVDLLLDYKGDADTFKQDAAQAFKSMSKTRGRKKEVTEISETFDRLYQQYFVDDVYGGDSDFILTTKIPRNKRARLSEAPDSAPPTKKAALKEDTDDADNTTISKALRSSMRQVITKISKLENADIFLYPVDSVSYPEYYEIIQSPMDITTVKNKLNSYISVEEMLRDIRQIWENCRIFNADGSDIVKMADKLAEASEALIEEHLGSEHKVVAKASTRTKKEKVIEDVALATQTTSKSSKSQSSKVEKKSFKSKPAVAEMVELPINFNRKALQKIISETKKHECAFVFAEPVNEDDAPGYFDVIKEPMDLSTIEKNIKSGKYDTDSSLFISDVSLIWKNCVTYNDPNSSIADWARIVAEAFADIVRKMYSDLNQLVHSTYDEILETIKVQLEERMVEDEEEEDGREEDGMDERGLDDPFERQKDLKGSESNGTSKRKRSKDIRKSDLNNAGRAMWTIIDLIKETPGYKSFLSIDAMKKIPGFVMPSIPMDLSKLRKNLPIYQNQSPDIFFKDSLLIFDSMLASDVSSELLETADYLKQVAVENFNLYFTKSESGEFVVNDVPKRKPVKKKSLDDSLEIGGIDFALPDSSDAWYQSTDSRIKTTAEIDSMIKILRSDGGPRTIAAKSMAAIKSQELLSKITYPWMIASNLFELQNIGAINNGPGFHDAKFVYPTAYKCSRLIHIAILPENNPAAGHMTEDTSDMMTTCQYIPIAISSTILGSFYGPRFVLTIDGGTIIAEANSPRDVWMNLFNRQAIEDLIFIRGDRLRHCRAILNRISIESIAQPFIDQNPSISSPLWFRKVHDRLMAGYYDNEFDFAWDIRYIFQSVLRTNDSSSELYLNTMKLKDLFEYLFCKWVINYQHRSLKDMAKGDWDYWKTLPLYDGLSTDENDLCALCHEKMAIISESTSSIPQNSSSDKLAAYSMDPMDIVDPEEPGQDESDVMDTTPQEIPSESQIIDTLHVDKCIRCRKALEERAPTFEEASSTRQQRHNISYQREEVLLPCFIPNPELGHGWCQALRQRRGGLKGAFLSPHGYYIKEKSGDFDTVKALEAELDERLSRQLMEEYQTGTTTTKYRRDMGIRYVIEKTSTVGHWSYQSWTHEHEPDLSLEITSNMCSEDRRISVGSLLGFKLPANHRYGVCIPNTDFETMQTLITNRTRDSVLSSDIPAIPTTSLSHITWMELKKVSLPVVGFYGLDVPDVKVRIEGNAAIDLCTSYTPLSADYCRQILIDDLLREREVSVKQDEQERSLIQIIQNERWFWEKKRYVPDPPKESHIYNESAQKTHLDQLKRLGFASLFESYSFTSSQGEILLCVWDMLDTISSLAGDWTFSLREVLSCLDKSSREGYPCLGQVIFDEISCLFTGILLQDQSSAIHDSELWGSILTYLPLNIVTWPTICRVVIQSSRRLGWNNEEIGQLLLTPQYDGWIGQCLEIIYLAFEHPLMVVIKQVMESHQDPSDDQVACQSLISSINTLKSNVIKKGSIQSLNEFSNHINEIADKTLAVSYSDPFIKLIVEQYTLWLRNVTQRWIHHGDKALMDASSLSTYDIPKECMIQLSSYFQNPDPYTYDFMLRGEHFHQSLLNKLSIFERKLHMIHQYERAFLLLRVKEHDLWTTEEKSIWLYTVIDMVYHTLIVQNSLKDKRNGIATVFSKIDDVPIQSSFTESPEHYREQVNFNDIDATEYVCCLTGTSIANLLTNGNPRMSRIVTVPHILLNPPGLSQRSKSNADELPEYVKADVDKEKLFFKGHSSSQLCQSSHFISSEVYVKRIATAREIALLEKRKKEAQFNELSNQLPSARLATLMANIEKASSGKSVDDAIILRSQPLGYDRHGNQYWLLVAQEHMTIEPLGSYGVSSTMEPGKIVPPALGLQAVKTIDPSILVRHTSGWWGYHSGFLPVQLANSFSSDHELERILRINIFKRYHLCQTKLFNSTLRSKSHQKEWLVRRLKLENHLKEMRYISTASSMATSIKPESKENMNDGIPVSTLESTSLTSGNPNISSLAIPSAVTPASLSLAMQNMIPSVRPLTTSSVSDVTKHIELIWARCTEIRQMVQYSMLLKKDFDIDPKGDGSGTQAQKLERDAYARRQKRIREANAEDTWDLHPTKGWLRFHCLAHVRELACSTIASRLHADPNLIPLLRESNSKCVFRIKWVEKSIKLLEQHQLQLQQRQLEQAAAAPKTQPVEAITEASQETSAQSMEQPSNISSAPIASGLSATPVDNVEASEEDMISHHSHNKVVEQLHPVTGEVLRLHPSGKAAALFMGTTSAGISLCCSGKTKESFGFRWRLYEGPAIDWEAIKDKQMSKEDLLAIVATKKTSTASSAATTSIAATPMSQLPIATSLIPSQPNAYPRPSVFSPPVSISQQVTRPTVPIYSYAMPQAPGSLGNPAMTQPQRFTTNYTASSVIVPPRLLKLKAELLNLFLLLPEKHLKWPESADGENAESSDQPAASKEDSNADTQATNSSDKMDIDDDKKADIALTAVQIKSENGDDTQQAIKSEMTENKATESISKASNTGVPPPIPTAADLSAESMEEKALRKKKRREKRRLAQDRFVSRIQNAMTATELFECVIAFEQALPLPWMLDYESLKQGQQNRGNEVLTSFVALRLFTLDRAIRYEDIAGIESIATKIVYRPRTQFVPRCMISVNCRLCLNHPTKCTSSPDQSSRFPEISDAIQSVMMSQQPYVPPVTTRPGLPAAGQLYQNKMDPRMPAQNMPGTNMYNVQQMNALQNKNALASRGKVEGMVEEEEEYDDIDYATRKKTKDFINIELVQGYVPPPGKYTMVEWI